ncbi:unnamed protein product [Somion occarium]|uniref:Uncharacterized protein n=1 Tax=Somion occarium TaxID=3059160 RepID=A0ABP1CXW0_9APHY
MIETSYQSSPIMVVETPKAVPFVLANAFTSDPFGGNPAAIVFLDSDLSSETLLNISKNFNQPMTTFILPSDVQDTENLSRSYRVRWFTTVTEVVICGHGTLAAAGVIFALAKVPSSVQVLNFVAKNGAKLTSRKVDNRVEITLPSTLVQPLPSDEEARWNQLCEEQMGRRH